MKNILFIASFISLFYLLKCLTSKDIWDQVISGKSNYTIINDTNYFIFQEKDYCKRDIYSEDMKKLYEKQKSFFLKRSTSNYIFVVENFYENLESIENGAFHLSQYLYNEFKVKMENSILALFSIQTRKIRIRTGEITKNNLTDSEVEFIISSLGDLLRQKNYYEAFLKYYDNLENFMNENNSIWFILIIVIFVILGLVLLSPFIVIAICFCGKICIRCISLPNDLNLKIIVSFLKSQKTNKKIFVENCIICLNKLSKNTKENYEEKEKNKLIASKEDDNKNIEEKEEGGNKNVIEKQEDAKKDLLEKEEDVDKPLIEKQNDDNKVKVFAEKEKEEDVNKEIIEKEENGISTLNCGHQFHTKCIIKWLKIKNNCPICRQIILNEKDNNKIVWNTQIELYPNLNNINYDHLYTRDFYVPPSSSDGNVDFSSNYCYVGGADCGGGATGGW